MGGIVIQGATGSLQGGSGGGVTIQGTSPSLQASNNSAQALQPAAAIPQNSGKVLGASTVSASTPTYDPAAAAAAAATAKAAALKTSITGLINNIHSVYDAIYGQVAAQGADKVGHINTNFGQQEDALTNTFNGDLNTSANNYSARGAYDSSYRQDNQNQLSDQFNNNQDQLAAEKQSDIAGVGNSVATTQGGINADRASIDQINQGIQASTDPDELQSVLSTVQDKLNTLQGGASAYNTTAQNIAAAPTSSNNLSSLEASLQNIVAGSAPSALKVSVGTKLIQSAGLSDDDTKQALANLQAAVGTTDPTKQNQGQ